VALLSAGSYRQGDAFDHSGPLEVSYRLFGDAWERVELLDDQGALLHVRDLHAELGHEASRLRIRWGGARIRDRYRWAEWRATVEVSGTSVLRWAAFGLEHPEETVREVSAGCFEIRTDTYGDADQLELVVSDLASARFVLRFEIDAYNKTGDALARNPDPVTPGAEREFTGTDLISASGGALRWELGGAELFLAAERLSFGPLPSRLEGRVTVPPIQGPNGHRALYLHARERDDAQVWTSPLFVTFQS
jgi:hypothetical protein